MKTYNYVVCDTETGSCETYNGTSLKDARKEVLKDIKDGSEFDLYCNDIRIWSAATDTVKELKSIKQYEKE